jgi:AcrR family transcriptional regulator
MTTAPRHSEESTRRAATRHRLLDAAYEVFADVGLAAATVEQITERAGFTRGAFYSNFTSKEQLFLAVIEQQAQVQLDVLNAGIARLDLSEPLDPHRLADLIGDTLALTAADRRWVVLNQEFWLAAVRDSAVAADFVALRLTLVSAVSSTIRDAFERCGLEFTVDPSLASRIIVNTYHDIVRDAAIVETDPAHVPEVRQTLAVVVLALTRPRHGD